ASSDPDNTNAKFFIRIDSMTGVNDVNGSGVIVAGEVAEIHWLIVPAPGTGGLTPVGIRYGVGATVSYTYGEESQTVNVAPDFIIVTPTPLLKLDYFLPADVFGDDPLTPEVEAIEPFDLGLRISNTGAGFADQLKIESAQPVIVENQQGLLIDFELLGTSVNDAPVTNSLLADIGLLEAGESAMVSWLMQSSLNGEFISFEADFVHSDELGGQLTSLIDAPIDTHILFHRVLVDYSGRDQIRDFLAYDQDILRVYESNGGQAQVIDESSGNVVTDLGVVDGKQKYQINFNTIAGAGFVRWSDPYNGVIQEVTAFRSDGKLLPDDNIWQYRIETSPGVYERYFGLFDVDSTGQYEIIINATAPNVAPVITVVTPQNGEVNTQLTFDIEVTDANIGDTISLVSIGAPSGSSVSYVSGNTWRFSWLPQQADVGTIDFILSASDQTLVTTEPVQLIVTPAGFIDVDTDGMADDWEMSHFGNLDETADGDFDLDSASNLQEHDFGGNPTIEDRPTVPKIFNVNDGATLVSNQTEFTVINSNSATEASVVYEFELYQNQISETPLATASIVEALVQTTWAHGIILLEDATYLWRVRAFDGVTPSVWNYDSFKYSAVNNPPIYCSLDSPIASQVINTTQPYLSIVAASDVDSDELFYNYQIFSDAELNNEIANSGWLNGNTLLTDNGLILQWQAPLIFSDTNTYYWQVSVKDELTTQNCGSGSFVINLNTSIPTGYTIVAPVGTALNDINVDLLVEHDANAINADDYSYYFEIDTLITFSSPALQQSAAINVDANNQVSWSLTNLDNDTIYYWRVKAFDSNENGQWIYARFRTDLATPRLILDAINPANNSWVSTLNPILKFQLDNRVKNLDNFTVEIYDDADANNLIFSQTIVDEQFIAADLVDRKYYYWQVRANLTNGSSSDYIPLQQFYIINEQVNDAPMFEFVSLTSTEENSTDIYTINWLDSDDDSNANIALYYDDNATGADGQLIINGIFEDDVSDSYAWDISAINNGEYYLYAIINDGNSSATVYSDNALIIEHHAINVQSSGFITSETGDFVTVSISLNKPPIDFVLIPVSVSEVDEAGLNVAQLLFTPTNWMDTQEIIVTGIDDTINDADQDYELLFGNVQSTDQDYANISLDSIALTNIGDGVYTPLVDIEMVKNIISSGPYYPGDMVSYELIISNQGEDDATGIVVTENMTNLTLVSASGGNCVPADTFPCTIALITAASSETITLVASINALGVFDNSASAHAEQTDIDDTNNTDDTNNNGISAGPDLGITISNCVSELSFDQNTIYEITVLNLGDLAISNARITSNMSVHLDNIIWQCQGFNGASCSQDNGVDNIDELMDFPIGSSVTYLVSARVIGAVDEIVSNTATIMMPGGITDINLSNNNAVDSDAIINLIFMDGFELINNNQCN
ncbi:hypothetical protein MNBD_GAMMA01-1486, partial [hydrothermal vent metagenome]